MNMLSKIWILNMQLVVQLFTCQPDFFNRESFAWPLEWGQNSALFAKSLIGFYQCQPPSVPLELILRGPPHLNTHLQLPWLSFVSFPARERTEVQHLYLFASPPANSRSLGDVGHDSHIADWFLWRLHRTCQMPAAHPCSCRAINSFWQ